MIPTQALTHAQAPLGMSAVAHEAPGGDVYVKLGRREMEMREGRQIIEACAPHNASRRRRRAVPDAYASCMPQLSLTPSHHSQKATNKTQGS